MNVIDVQIRWMIRRDFQQVLSIEQSNFDDPWSEEELLEQLRHRNTIGMVAESDDEILGFMIYSLEKTEIVFIDMAVKEIAHRCGIGRQMIDRAKRKINEQRRKGIIARVGDSNLNAHLFFRSQGFKAERVIRDHYSDGQDAYQFAWNLPGYVPQEPRDCAIEDGSQ